MSILVRGMEMPKTEPLLLKIYPDGRVAINFDSNVAKAVDLQPHGRLIDADALDEAFTDMRWKDGDYRTGELAHWGDRPNWCLSGRDIDGLIQSAPTIIPAEEDET